MLTVGSELLNLYCLLLMSDLISSQIHANCRIRRVYFSDRLYSEDELPAEFKLYLPVQNQKAKVRHTQTTVYICVSTIIMQKMQCKMLSLSDFYVCFLQQ